MDGVIDRARWRTTLTYQVLSSLSLGLEWNPAADDVGVLANWRALAETRLRPALVFGTSSDRIGTEDGRAYFGTLSKRFGRFGPYAGLSYGEHESKLRTIGGLDVLLGAGFSLLGIHDGVNLHGAVTWSRGPHAVTLLMVDLRDPGLAYSIRF